VRSLFRFSSICQSQRFGSPAGVRRIFSIPMVRVAVWIINNFLETLFLNKDWGGFIEVFSKKLPFCSDYCGYPCQQPPACSGAGRPFISSSYISSAFSVNFFYSRSPPFSHEKRWILARKVFLPSQMRSPFFRFLSIPPSLSSPTISPPRRATFPLPPIVSDVGQHGDRVPFST